MDTAKNARVWILAVAACMLLVLAFTLGGCGSSGSDTSSSASSTAEQSTAQSQAAVEEGETVEDIAQNGTQSGAQNDEDASTASQDESVFYYFSNDEETVKGASITQDMLAFTASMSQVADLGSSETVTSGTTSYDSWEFAITSQTKFYSRGGEAGTQKITYDTFAQLFDAHNGLAIFLEVQGGTLVAAMASS